MPEICRFYSIIVQVSQRAGFPQPYEVLITIS
ncbi:hypothetical protein NIES2100_77300 [Calothrix sp. NIES-2100]|nr:hypothetical protein NIES2100_77300 [Calothrix sp. NIES-2100]